MDTHNSLELELEEPLSIQVKKTASNEKKGICSWLRRIFNLDDIPNQKHHRPVFIIIMCILHVIIHLLTYINTTLKGQKLADTIYNLLMFFGPCMRPTPDAIRMQVTHCNPLVQNTTCYYDDELKKLCSTFLYPYQLWRMITVNLFHMNVIHLLSNLSKQLMYGIPLEHKYGSIRIAIIYWFSELGASLSFLIKNSDKSSIGASGALYGLMLFFVTDRLIAMKTNAGRRLFIFTQIAVLVLLPMCITILLIHILKLSVAHSAHFGGGLVGFLFGCMLAWNNEQCIYRTICRRVAFILLSLYYILTLAIFFLRDAPIVKLIY